MEDREFLEMSFHDLSVTSTPFELHKVMKGDEEDAKRSITSIAGVDALTDTEGFMDLTKKVRGWLPFASEPYRISKSLADYVVIPVMIMPSELPNRNGVGFPFRELTRFSPDTGCLMYKSWVGKPTHVEHQNQNPVEAKGVILDTAIRPMTGYEGSVWKVVSLLAFDRSKDAMLVNDILTRKRTAYSMGAYVKDYECSICAKSLKSGGCDHVDKQRPQYRLYNGSDLAYYRAIDPIGFETSSVATPAYVTADNPSYFNMLMNQ
jgi:hypothetical protein